jgi:hypothetical protein
LTFLKCFLKKTNNTGESMKLSAKFEALKAGVEKEKAAAVAAAQAKQGEQK